METDSDRAIRHAAAGKKRSQELQEQPASAGSSQFVPVPAQTGAPLTVSVVDTEDAFSALGKDWTDLLSECTEPTVFMSHEWMHSWWRSYKPAAELAILVVRRGDRLRALAPLLIETTRRGGVRVRALRFIGDGTGETDHVNFLVAAEDHDDVFAELVRGIAQLRWDVAHFNQMPARSREARALLDWIRQERLAHGVETTACPVCRLPRSFDELLAQLPSRLRTSIRSTRRKVAERHRVEFGMYAPADSMALALLDFFRNHESRWQGKGIRGAFSNQARRRFYEQLTPLLMNRGWLRFFFLRLDGRTVAQQYCFAVDDTVMLLQEGFDFAHAQDNVGNLLRSFVFEHLIATGASTYDFLAGGSRHKEAWTNSAVHDLRIRCARSSWRGLVAFRVPHAVERLKDRLRPWRDRIVSAFVPHPGRRSPAK